MYGSDTGNSTTNGGCLQQELPGVVPWYLRVVTFNEKLGR